MTTLTNWYPALIPPIRSGVFETTREDDKEEWFSYWDGKNWNGQWSSPRFAIAHCQYGEGASVRRWRGLYVEALNV